MSIKNTRVESFIDGSDIWEEMDIGKDQNYSTVKLAFKAKEILAMRGCNQRTLARKNNYLYYF